MKAMICLATAALVVGSAVAQQESTQAPKGQSEKDQSKQMSTSSSTSNTSGAVAEMKTRTYKGVLMDASCAGVQTSSPATAGAAAMPGTPSNPGTPATPGSETRPASNTANRSASDTASGSCGVSSSTSQFAMKLEDGRTLAFDMVGNERAKEQIQKSKKWTEYASSGKPINAKVSGVISGEKLVVSSIH